MKRLARYLSGFFVACIGLVCLAGPIIVSRSAYRLTIDGWGLTTYVVAMDFSSLWWVPGYRWCAELEGALLAKRDFSQGHLRLLGAGQRGTSLLGLEECEVVAGPARNWLLGLINDDGDLPKPLPEPSGTAVVRCNDEAGRASGHGG